MLSVVATKMTCRHPADEVKNINAQLTLSNTGSEPVERLVITYVLRDASGRPTWSTREYKDRWIRPGGQLSGDDFRSHFNYSPTPPASVDVHVLAFGADRLAVGKAQVRAHGPVEFDLAGGAVTVGDGQVQVVEAHVVASPFSYNPEHWTLRGTFAVRNTASVAVDHLSVRWSPVDLLGDRISESSGLDAEPQPVEGGGAVVTVTREHTIEKPLDAFTIAPEVLVYRLLGEAEQLGVEPEFTESRW